MLKFFKFKAVLNSIICWSRRFMLKSLKNLFFSFGFSFVQKILIQSSNATAQLSKILSINGEKNNALGYN